MYVFVVYLVVVVGYYGGGYICEYGVDVVWCGGVVVDCVEVEVGVDGWCMEM